MHRPPRPVIKSSQMLPLHPIRRLLTPETFFSDQEVPLQDLFLKNTRENPLSSHLAQLNLASESQHSEFPDKVEHTVIKAPMSTYTRSFKIRNHMHNHRIKENTIPIKTTRRIPGLGSLISSKNKTVQAQKQNPDKKQQTIIFSNVPRELDLGEVATRINFHAFENKQESNLGSTADDPCWETPALAVIISQNLFSSSVADEMNVKKIKKIVRNVKLFYNPTKVIFKLQQDRELPQIIKAWVKADVGADFIIWPKAKYYERVSVFDISEIVNICGAEKVLSISDQFDYCESVYFSDDNQESKVDSKVKFAYIKFRNINSLSDFAGTAKLDEENDMISSDSATLKDDTDEIMELEELRGKIELSKNRKNRKACRVVKRKSSSKEINRDYMGGSMHSIQDKTEDFKRKMIQYVKILQEDVRSSKDLGQKPGSARSARGPLRLLQLQHEFRNVSKTSTQLVFELLKNNSLVHKQITKYQDEMAGVEIIPCHQKY